MGLGRAVYECRRCGHRWESAPSSQTECRKCGSLYCIWLNYEEWERSPERTERFRRAYPK